MAFRDLLQNDSLIPQFVTLTQHFQYFLNVANVKAKSYISREMYWMIYSVAVDKQVQDIGLCVKLKLLFCYDRSSSALAAKLEARKRKRYGAEHAKLSKQILIEENANQRKILEKKQHESQLLSDNIGETTKISHILIGDLPAKVVRPESSHRSVKSTSFSLGVTLTGNQEQDWVNLLMASPLFKQINDLEGMLERSDNADEIVQRPHIKGTVYSSLHVLV